MFFNSTFLAKKRKEEKLIFWGEEENARHLNASLSALARLHILEPEVGEEEEGGAEVNDSTVFVLNDQFRTSLRQALTGG